MTFASINAVIVLQPFGSYVKGQLVTDPTIIATILSGGNASKVIKTQVVQQQEPAGASPAVEH